MAESKSCSQKRTFSNITIETSECHLVPPIKTFLPMSYEPFFSIRKISPDFGPTEDTMLELELVSNIKYSNKKVIHKKSKKKSEEFVEFNYSDGVAGYASKFSPDVVEIGKQYGEDVVVSDNNFIGCFDGHSTNSEELSANAAIQCKYKFTNLEFKNKLSNYLKNDEFDEAEIFLKQTYNEIRSSINKLPMASDAGTTVCVCHNINFENRRWLVFVNIGDSDGYIVNNKTGQVLIATNSHSWDNPIAYQQYVDNCIDNGITPVDAIYHRFNNGDEKCPKFKDENDKIDKPFKIFDINDGQVTVNEKNRDFIWKKIKAKFKKVGGSQAICRMLIKNSKGDLEPFPTTEHLNWGSTAMTKLSCQAMSGFGDKIEHESSGVSDDLIHIYIHELDVDDDVTAIVSSDGFSDCIHKYKIGSTVSKLVEESDSNSQEIANNLMEQARKLATNSEFKWGLDELVDKTYTIRKNMNYSRHDDMSIAVLRTTKKN